MGVRRKQSDTGCIEVGLAMRRSLQERMFRALHDEVGGAFTGLGLELELLRLELLKDNPDLARKIGESQQHLDVLFDRVRALSYEAHPDPVGKLGFEVAVDLLVARARRKYQGNVRVSFTAEGGLAEPFARDCYNFMECLLDNVIEGSYSSNLSFSTAQREQGVTVVVRDDGNSLGRVLTGSEVCIKYLSYLRDAKGYEIDFKVTPGHGTMVQLNGLRGNDKLNAN